MREFLASSERKPLTAALCSYFYETYVIELLEKGGIFKCHALMHENNKSTPTETILVIPPPGKVAVDKVESNQTRNQCNR
jgi:hypothetical protein